VNPQLLHQLSSAIREATHRPCALHSASPVGGGCINATYRLTDSDGACLFLKLNEARHHAMLAAEASGLDTLAATRTLHVPHPVAYGIAAEHSFLVVEHLDLNSHGDARMLGEQLAALHRHTASRFGFAQDNFIGTTPQPNAWTDDWIIFWREQRLGYQLRLAANNGYGGRLQTLGENLLAVLPALLAGHTPQPSLLHGDLWSGNHGYLADGTPVIFDPAPYYGDRECDIAMTELFGGFPAAYYDAYRASFPLDSGYPVRRELYNLYHILNHANMFGGSYVRQAEGMMERLLAG